MLKNVRVIDFTVYLPGPFASMRLADLGAEVIKVEPVGGEPARSMNNFLFLANNRNKKSICINLKEESGQQAVLDLIREADVVIESFRPGVMAKLGLDYETVKKINRNIIYCSITGFGQQSSLSQLGSHDLNYMSISGVLAQLKDENGKPVHPTHTFADMIGGIAANEAILAALFSREKNGEGQYIDISLADVMISLMGNHVLIENETGFQHGVDLLAGMIINYAIYETSDHRFVSLAALEQKFWRNFCNGVGRPSWVDGYLTKTDSNNPIYEDVKSLFKSKTFQEWIAFSQEVDCCLTPVLEAGELTEFHYIKEKELIFELDGIRQVKTNPLFLQDELRKPPAVGEHTTEILNKIEN